MCVRPFFFAPAVGSGLEEKNPKWLPTVAFTMMRVESTSMRVFINALLTSTPQI